MDPKIYKIYTESKKPMTYGIIAGFSAKFIVDNFFIFNENSPYYIYYNELWSYFVLVFVYSSVFSYLYFRKK